MGAMIIISTFPNKKSVLKTANVVVQKQLAACVNFTKINSVYTWKGKMEKTEEFLAFFKLKLSKTTCQFIIFLSNPLSLLLKLNSYCCY